MKRQLPCLLTVPTADGNSAEDIKVKKTNKEPMKEEIRLRVRPYRRGDAEEIVKWCDNEEAFYKWSAGILGEYPLTVQRFTDATSGRDDNDKYFPFSAVDENGVVGFFTLRQPEDDYEELRFGFVILNPAVRGKGYGKQMLKLGLKFALDVYGAKSVRLGVFENNPSAYYCYKAVGFWETGKSEEYGIKGKEWKCLEMEYKDGI